MNTSTFAETSPPPGVLTAFFGFVSAYRYILLYTLGYGFAPVIIDLVFPIFPPWPDSFGVAAFTSITIWLVLIFVYVSWAAIAQKNLRSLTRRSIVLAGSGLTAYVILTILFVYNAPDFHHREAGGYQLRPEIEDLLRSKPGLSIEDVFEAFEYKPTRVWTDASVRQIRALLLVTWLSFFGLLSVAIAVFVLHEQKSLALAAARANKSKRVTSQQPKGVGPSENSPSSQSPSS